MEDFVSIVAVPSFELGPSKSMVNRQLIIDSFFVEESEYFENSLYLNEAEDVTHLRQALCALKAGRHEFYVGGGGTTLRFLALRVSRESGFFELRGEKRLFERPQQELISMFEQLGVRAEITESSLKIESTGKWNLINTIKVDASQSSQFLSALALSSFFLPSPLRVKISTENSVSSDFLEQSSDIASEAYWRLTKDMVIEAGLEIEELKKNPELSHQENFTFDFVFEATDKNDTNKTRYKQNKSPSLRSTIYSEADASSVFSLAAASLFSRGLVVENFSEAMDPRSNKEILPKWHPDRVFLNVFEAMGVEFDHRGKKLKITPLKIFQPIEMNLSDSPDLFPVLSALLLFSLGPSVLTGLSTLPYKESHRIQKMQELLALAGGYMDVLNADRVKIIPLKDLNSVLLREKFVFDADQDHRLAFAVGVLKKAGFKIDLLNQEAVKKSYPDYWRDWGRL